MKTELIDAAKMISDIVRSVEKKYFPEPVHPDTMGEEIASRLHLYAQRERVEGEWGLGAYEHIAITGSFDG